MAAVLAAGPAVVDQDLDNMSVGTSSGAARREIPKQVRILCGLMLQKPVRVDTVDDRICEKEMKRVQAIIEYILKTHTD